MGFFKEVIKDRSLRYFGVALASTHLVALFAWVWDRENPLALRVFADARALCWPGTGALCMEMRPFFLEYGDWALALYALLALASAMSFLLPQARSIFWAMILLLVTFLLQNLIRFQDYRFMGNFHYMNAWVHFFFLFLPRKRLFLPLLVGTFYVAAATLKFNSEWLEGQAFIRPTILPEPLLFPAALYVIVLELIFVPLMLFAPAHQRRVKIAVFLQLVVFHLFSWHIVSYLYPLTMLLLLSIFPLLWLLPRESPPEAKSLPWSALAVYALFLILQTVPLWVAGPARLTGEGRLFSVNMLDSRLQCQNVSILHYSDRSVEVSDFGLEWGLRISCDPWLHYALAQAQCRARSAESPTFMGLDWALLVRRSTSENFELRVKLENFCEQAPGYSTFQRNLWIELGQDFGPSVDFGLTPRSTYPAQEQSGSPTWRYALPHTLNRLEDVLPVFEEDGSFYVPTNSGWLWKISRDGKLEWRHYFNEAILGLTPHLLFSEDSVTVQSRNGREYILDKKSGRLRRINFKPEESVAAMPETFGEDRWTRGEWFVTRIGATLQGARR
jgi:hypothetical protein